MADEHDNDPVHPDDKVDAREFILNTNFGIERERQLKELFPKGAERNEYWLPYCSAPGSYECGFTQQANYEYFEKNYPWLHKSHQQIGLDADEINPYVPAYQRAARGNEDEFASFEEFLTTIPQDSWNSFIEDAERLESYPDMDEQRSNELRMKAEEEYWEEYGFKSWLEDAIKKFRENSFQQWVLASIEPWDAYHITSNAGHYMEEEGGGSVYIDTKRAVEAIEWEDVEREVDEATLRESYEAAKLACWHGSGGDQFFQACQRHAATDQEFSNGLLGLDVDRLKAVYDRVVVDENSASNDLPAYVVIGGEDEVAAEGANPARPAQPQRLVVSFGLEDDKEREAADAVVVLARDLIAKGRGMLPPPVDHPELSFESRQVFGRQTVASDRWIPKAFKIDEEFGCQTAAEALAKMVPKLKFVVGRTRLGLKDEWGDHAWCVAPDGVIVDPYHRYRFPKDWQRIEYAEDQSVFDGRYLDEGQETPKDFIMRQPRDMERRREAVYRIGWTSGKDPWFINIGGAEATREAPFWDFWFDVDPEVAGSSDDPHVVKSADDTMRFICDHYFDLDPQTSLKRIDSKDNDFVYRITDPFEHLLEGVPIPDPFDADKLTPEQVRDWILTGGTEVGDMLCNTERLYLIIPGDEHTLQKYIPHKHLYSYRTTIVGVSDPTGKFKSDESNFCIDEDAGQLNYSGFGTLESALNDPLYGADLKQALLKRYKAMAKEGQLNDAARFKDAILYLMQVGGHDALLGFYKHIKPGQIYRFDIRYGLELLKRGRLAAAAKRFGVSRQQISKDGYFYAVPDWSDTTNFFYHGNREDFRSSAKKVFDGDVYGWFDGFEADLNTAIDMLLPAHYAMIRELLVWAEVKNPYLDGEPFFDTPENHDIVETVVLNKEMVAALTDDNIDDMLKNAEEFDYEDNTLDEIVDALKSAYLRAQETAYSDAYYIEYTEALTNVLGPSKFGKINGKDMLTFLIPWPDMVERLKKANEDQGDYEGSLDDLVENYSEPAQPGDNIDADWGDIKKWFQTDYVQDCLADVKPHPGPPPRPQDPNQMMLPLPESRQMLLEGYKYGCTMIHLPPKQAQFLLQWGQLNIPDDVLHDPPDDDTMGREDEMHTTVKYGLQTKGVPEAVRTLVADTAAFPVYIGSISLFRQEDYDVVKLGVESPWLTALHDKVGEVVPCPGDKWPSYKPHVTLAYVKTSSCDHLVGQDPFSAEGSPGAEFVAYEVEYTGPGEIDGDRVKESFPLNKTDWRPEEVKESEEAKEFEDVKDFIMQQPLVPDSAAVGYSVKFKLPDSAKSMYLRPDGRTSRRPGDPLPLETASHMLHWVKDMYGDEVFSLAEIEPVYETTTAL